VEAGDQGVEVGDVFVEITEKTPFPGFRFLGGVEFGPWQKQEKAPGEKLRFGGSRIGVRNMLCLIQEPKWKSRLRILIKTDVEVFADMIKRLQRRRSWVAATEMSNCGPAGKRKGLARKDTTWRQTFSW
jgi:hypothetical protein